MASLERFFDSESLVVGKAAEANFLLRLQEFLKIDTRTSLGAETLRQHVISVDIETAA